MFGRKVSIGMDLGSHSVRCAAVEAETGRVRGLWQAELMPGRSQSSDTLGGDDLECRLRLLLPGCQKELPGWNRTVVTAVQSRSTVCGYMELPKLSDKELRVAVPSRIAKHIPFNLEDVVLSYQAVPAVVAADRTGLVYVAVPRKVVDPFSQLLRNCGLEPRRIEVAPLALAREFATNHGASSKGQFVALIHAGFRFTQFTVVRDGFPYYVRQFALAGADFTYAFQMGAQSSWKEAEQYKLEYDARKREVPIEPFLTRWLEELRRSRDDCQRRFVEHQLSISRVSFSGGTALVKGLAERMAEHLGLPVVVDGWEKLTPPKPAPAAAPYTLAVGLALGE